MSSMEPVTSINDPVAPVTLDLVESTVDTPSTLILETILALSDKEVTEIDQLSETIDPDALDNLFAYDASASGAASVELIIDSYVVTVRDDGLVRFESRSE